MGRKLLTIATVTLSLVAVTSAWAGTETVLHAFAGGVDGAYPTSGLVQKGSDLYGATSQGGANGCGTVFRLRHGTKGWKEKVLYTFGCDIDGVFPSGSIAIDKAGDIFGTTGNGGSNFKGNVYEVSPTSGGGWVETTLYSFTGSDDGGSPFGGIVLDKAGNLYGTTYEGGSMTSCQGAGCGVVFELVPGSGGWTEVVLHAFTESDGALSGTPLTIDASGNLYGSTSAGGNGAGCVGSPANGCGVVFELASSNGTWTESVLHDFRTDDNNDGISPNAVVLHGGDLYGTTSNDGATANGTVFKLTRSKTWKERVLHRFAGNKDGAVPMAGVAFDKLGNLFGTTQSGGNSLCNQGCGIVFELASSGQKWTETILHRFAGGKDGANPVSSLNLDGASNIYGTATFGGKSNMGIVFVLAP